MGVTIHYHGTLDRADSVEAVQDRVLDFALALGGRAQYWYSRGDGAAGRAVRGVIVDLAPGCDSMSLLFSEEGRLVPLHDIEAAEQGPLPRDTFAFVKTQFAPVETHVAIVALLRFLKKSYASDLEVLDDGEYWESSDLARLLRLRGTIERALGAIEDGLRAYPLSAGAREDADIAAARVESVARLAHETLRRAPEHAPVRADEGDEGESEAFWDEVYRENVRRVERLVERVEREGSENLSKIIGELVRPPEPAGEAEDAEDAPGLIDWEEEEPAPTEEALDAALELEPAIERERDPLLARTEKLFVSLRAGPDVPQIDSLQSGLCEALGGFAQAQDRDDDLPFGLRIVQLKRALRGLAFARGAVLGLRAEGRDAIGGRSLRRLGRAIDEISEAAIDRLRDLRSGLAGAE